MEPAKKATEIRRLQDRLLRDCGGPPDAKPITERIRENRCNPPPLGCGGPAETFRNDKSRREFGLSGMCQTCQDAFFGTD